MRGRGRVLIVDDSSTNRSLIAALVESLGLEVETADDGGGAAAVVGTHPPPVAVIMDMEMPIVDGARATRLIRGLPAPFRETAIIGASADGRIETRELGLASGMNDFLVKPIDRAALEAALRRVGALSGREG